MITMFAFYKFTLFLPAYNFRATELAGDEVNQMSTMEVVSVCIFKCCVY